MEFSHELDVHPYQCLLQILILCICLETGHREVAEDEADEYDENASEEGSSGDDISEGDGEEGSDGYEEDTEEEESKMGDEVC